jgi:hypothetical protein
MYKQTMSLILTGLKILIKRTSFLHCQGYQHDGGIILQARGFRNFKESNDGVLMHIASTSILKRTLFAKTDYFNSLLISAKNYSTDQCCGRNAPVRKQLDGCQWDTQYQAKWYRLGFGTVSPPA